MIYRLRYCNKNGVEARVDIQKGLATPVIEVEGTGQPFILSYNNDKGNKSGLFLSSSADIEVYETPDFNIDNLKTSNETELSVTYYIDNVVKWKGFIIPDFFSIEVRNNPVIAMTASDRLGTLKNVTLTDLPAMVNIRELAIMCLNKTGLSLPLNTIADFSNDGVSNAFFNYYIDSQRIKDIKGRSISCYDILSSILIAINSKLVQREGEWVIINKLQHEIGSGNVYSSLSSFTTYLENIYNFQNVSVGARRTITPVAGSIGIYHEHGGRKSHPANYDFSLDLSGWNSNNGFVATIENKHITGYLGGTPMFDPDRVVKQYLLNYNNWIDNTNNLNTAPYISTDPIPINSPRADRVEVTVDISSTMAERLSSNTMISFLRYAVILTNGTKTYTLTKAGIFEELDPENISGHSLLLRGGQQAPLLLASPALSNSETLKGLFEVGEEDNVNDYSATIRIYGSGDQYVTVNYALIKFSDVSEIPKGTIYKVEQGEVFTKAYDVETSIFGDYLLSGLNGYFYRYPNDDTSSIYKNVDTLSNPVWTTPMVPNETSELPLLHHSARQMRRLFSVAHDLLSAQVEADNFDPLAIFVDCNDNRYTVVSAQFDFFRSSLSVELEEVAYQNNIIREFIYSYFGEGENNIKSIGGIASGGGGTGGGGGMTSEQLEMLTNLASWWKLDEENDAIYSEKSVYSLKGVSALGLGDGGGDGGGSDYDRLDKWADYDSSKSGWVLSALLGYDLHTRAISLDTRVTDLELNSGSGTVTSVGLTVPTGLSVAGSPITEAGTFEISFAPGYSIPTTEKQGQWDIAYTNSHTHSNKSVIDALTQGHIDVLSKLSLDVQGNVKVDATLWATGGLSALGLGDGGGSGGGVDMLDSWANYTTAKEDYYVPASLLVPFRSDTLNRLTSLEGGSATSITTTGGGNAITSVSKSGNTLTFTKGSTFSLSTHNHDTIYKPISYVPSWSEITDKPSTLSGYGITDGVNKSLILTAGNGLTGGGALSADRTLTLGTPSDITATSTNSVTATSHTHSLSMGSGSGLDADLLDGKHGSDYRGAINLPHIADHEQIVIGLVNLDNSNAGRESWSSGQIYVNRTNGVSWSGGVINYSVQKKYNASTMWGYIDSTQSGIQLCTFTYNGVKYGGIRFYPAASQVYGGTKLYGRWSDTTPFVVKYRNNSGVLNSEVANSIVINGSDVLEQRLRTSDNIYAFTSDNVASATKLKTARTLWGQSFNGTGNVTGNISNTGNITPSATATHNIGTSSLMYERAYIRRIDTQSGYVLRFNVAGNEYMTINTSGNVGIGTTSPSQKLHVAGNIIATGEVTAYVASDRRLKENITPIASALDYINRLNPVTYNWNAKAKELNANKPNGLDYGLIAQEVESVLPNIVHGIFDDKYKSIDYIKLIPIMIGAIKELKQEINKLKK